MASAPCLEIEALLAPVPGENPAGTRFPLTSRQKFEALRKDFEPHPDDPSQPPVPKKPDWPLIKRLAEETLIKTSKDLEVALRLTEALVKLHGFAGLRDGLHLLHELAAQCWDRLHPIPDEGEGMGVRGERFYWITENESGARFPQSVRAIPLVKVKDQGLSYQDLVAALSGQGPVPAAAFESAEPIHGDVAEDVAQCTLELNGLEKILEEKCGPEAPALTGLRLALEECHKYMTKVMRQFAPASAGGSAGGADSPNGAEEGPGFAGGGNPQAVGSREEAYRHLAHIANVLEQLEPHSPIPDMLRRAIELGKMPFRQLIQELIRDPNQLTEVRREFGLKKADAEAPP